MDALKDYQKISNDFLDTSIECENLFEKSATVSTEARKAGNQLYTQKQHDKNVHKNILLLYSKSVAFAPNNSEELALGYSNRSALLLHLHQYQKSLVDVNRALQITQSNKLKCKLQARKHKCLNLMDNSKAEKDRGESRQDSSFGASEQMKNGKGLLELKKNDEVLKLPGFKPHPYIQSASEAVTVKYNKKYGRHLVATRYIKPGEVIVAERGYACYPIICNRHLICSHCLSFAWNGTPCESCAFAVYCSESCKEDAWKQYHDVECTLFQYISCLFYDDESFVPDLIIAARLFIIAVKKDGIDAVMKEAQVYNGTVEGLMVNGKLRSDEFKSCINLHSYIQNIQGENDFNFNLLILVQALFDYTDFFDSKKDENDQVADEHLFQKLKSILKKLIGVVNVNTFKYQATTCNCESLTQCQSKCESIRGVILAPFGSLINHSCNSNVSRMFLPNGKLIMFTVAPVNEGEQLFESYGPSILMEKDERQRHLRRCFNFTCDCQPCKDNWPSGLELAHFDEKEENSSSLKVVQEFRKTFPHVLDSTIFSDDDNKWQFDEETLKHAIKLSELNYQYVDNYMLATFYNQPYRQYIDKAYYMLYGEKCVVPDKC